LSNRVEPEIPSITLDQDQVKSLHKKTASTGNNNAPIAKNSPKKVNSSSTANNFFTVVIYLILCGAVWFFYQQNLKLHTSMVDSERRIQQLENQLSATGEEMGESTIALKIKLEAMTDKTEKLWAEMDKLWASAWRRNQSEIKEVRSKNIKQLKVVNANKTSIDNVVNSIADIKDQQTSSELNINALGDQINAANNIRADLDKLRSQLTSLNEKSSGRDNQQMEVATTVNQLDTMIKLMLERVESIEAKLDRKVKSPVAKAPIEKPTQNL